MFIGGEKPPFARPDRQIAYHSNGNGKFKLYRANRKEYDGTPKRCLPTRN